MNNILPITTTNHTFKETHIDTSEENNKNPYKCHNRLQILYNKKIPRKIVLVHRSLGSNLERPSVFGSFSVPEIIN